MAKIKYSLPFWFNMERLLIKNDLFNICKRIKQIDKKYFIVLNKKTKKFEVHYKRNFSTLELVLPFDRLDKRTLDFVLKTRMEHKQKLIEEMEKNNQKLLDENNKNLLDEATYKAKEMLNYAHNKVGEVNFDKTYLNKWY